LSWLDDGKVGVRYASDHNGELSHRAPKPFLGERQLSRDRV